MLCMSFPPAQSLLALYALQASGRWCGAVVINIMPYSTTMYICPCISTSRQSLPLSIKIKSCRTQTSQKHDGSLMSCIIKIHNCYGTMPTLPKQQAHASLVMTIDVPLASGTGVVKNTPIRTGSQKLSWAIMHQTGFWHEILLPVCSCLEFVAMQFQPLVTALP